MKALYVGSACTILAIGVAFYGFNGGTIPSLWIGILGTIAATFSVVATIAITLQGPKIP